MALLYYLVGLPPFESTEQLANAEMDSASFPYGTGDGYFGGNWHRYSGYCYIEDGKMIFPAQDYAWQDVKLAGGTYEITLVLLNAASVPFSVRVNAQGGTYLVNTTVQGPATVTFPFTAPDIASMGNGLRVEVSNNGAIIDAVRLRNTPS